ncbi:MAG: hypothetical protein ACJA1S_001846, partial [Cellvibrionaceae bacterium]
KNIDSKYSPRLRSKPNGLTLQKIDNHQSIRANSNIETSDSRLAKFLNKSNFYWLI